MADEFEGKIDAEGKFELTRSFWKTLKATFALPQVSRRLAQAAAKKKVLDWYDIRDYPLDTARNDKFITGFPSRGGDCILVLSITEGASAQIKFDNVNSDAFELANYRKLRHNFSNLYLNNTAQAGSTLKILFGRGDWEVVRHHPEEEIVAINADTVDGLHASASIEAGSLLALGPDGFFPCGAVRCLQNELFANLPAAPVVGDVFISSDTGELYICFTAGVWTNILTPAADQIAFTPAGGIIATNVQAAIEELDAEKIADIADVINDTHIDWGLGANQVSAADMPIADPGGIIVATQVEGALQEIMTDLNIAEVAIVAAQADIDGFPDELKNLIIHEIQQLETLGAVTTISAIQWGWVGEITAWNDWVPVYGGGGAMTFGATTTWIAKYCQIGKVVYFVIRASGTTGGVASTNITFTLPSAPLHGVNTLFGGCAIYEATWESGFFINVSVAATVAVHRYDGANWGLGAGRNLFVEGFYEVA